MKKLICVLIAAVLTVCLTACTKDTFMDISAFTDYYNRAAGEKVISLSDYLYRDGAYSRVFERDGEQILLTLETDSEGKIGEIRLMIPKVDGNGKEKPIKGPGKELFTNTLLYVIQAFTVYNSAESEAIAAEMKMNELSSFNSRGELTLTKDEWHFVYYSTQISSVFIIYNIHLSPVEKTQKPESKPAFGNTAHTRQ